MAVNYSLWEEVVTVMEKEYLYKCDNKGKLVSGVTKLADPRLGAAIKSFRSREESKSKLPLVFWE